MKRVSVFIDGGHLRSYAKKANKPYTPSFVVTVAKACVNAALGEELFRVLYYDCDPYAGTVSQPISAVPRVFSGSKTFLDKLAEEEGVAVRRGVLKFRGWDRTRASLASAASASNSGLPAPPLNDADFSPRFEQKGVDLRIGLDMTAKSNIDSNGLMVLMTGDTDLIPALKIVRARGIQVAGVNFPNYQLIGELKQHLDVYRTVGTW